MCRTEPDVHHAAGMSCTDCHLHTELMGDGETYLHEDDAVEISCQSCHGPADAGLETTWDDVQDSITSVLLRVNLEWRPDDERVRTGRRGTPLWNVRPPREPVAPWLDGTWVLRAKVLRVGPCLECHEEAEWWYDSFELVMTGIDPRHPEELEGRESR